MHPIAGWWDGLELWVVGLPFVPQFLIVLAVTIPVAFAMAWSLDHALAATLRLLGRDRDTASSTSDSPAGSDL